MFPLFFLEWTLDDSFDDIDDLPESAMAFLRQVSRHNIWHVFLPACFHRWILWRYESTKWLARCMALCIEALHTLWLKRCRIVHECMLSKVRVEDHCNLLNQVKQLYQQLDISPSSVLHQYKYKLNNINTETLRGIAYKLLSTMNVDSSQTLFHSDLRRSPYSTRRELTSSALLRRDQATARRHDLVTTRKRNREEFEDMVERRTKRGLLICTVQVSG